MPRRQAVFRQYRRRDDWWLFNDGRWHTAELPFAVPANQQANQTTNPERQKQRGERIVSFHKITSNFNLIMSERSFRI